MDLLSVAYTLLWRLSAIQQAPLSLPELVWYWRQGVDGRTRED